MGAALTGECPDPDLPTTPRVLLQRQLRRAMEGTDLHRQLDVHDLQRADRRRRGCTLDWRRNTVRYRRGRRASGRASASGSRTPPSRTTTTRPSACGCRIRLCSASPRTATATAPDLEHSENVVHLQFMWTIPVTSKFELTAMVGPSFFTVRQTVASVRAPQDISDPPPLQ